MKQRAIYPDLDPERALLGGLVAEEVIPDPLGHQLTVDSFSPPLRLVTSAVLAAHENHGRCDLLTVAEELTRLGGGLEARNLLMQLAESAPVGADLVYLWRLVQTRNGSPSAEPFSRPLSHLLSVPDEPVPFLVERLLVQGANGFIGGEPKSLKSWVALHIALCLSLGVSIFGRYSVPKPVRVLLISEEDGERRVRRRIRKLLAGLGMNAPEDGFFRYAIKAGVLLDDPKWVDRIRAELAEYRPAIVIGDVFELMHSQDGDKRAAMKPVFRNLDRLREEHGCGFLLADHFRKAAIGVSKRGGQRLSGTVGKHAFGECSLYLFPAQGVNRVRVETELKDGPSEVFGLALEDTEDGGVRFVWEAEAEDRASEMKEKILAAIVEASSPDGWATAAQVGQAAGIAKNTARKYLDLLVDEDKKVERQRLQRGKVKAWCYRLTA